MAYLKCMMSRWLDISLVAFSVFMDREGSEVHKHAE